MNLKIGCMTLDDPVGPRLVTENFLLLEAGEMMLKGDDLLLLNSKMKEA